FYRAARLPSLHPFPTRRSSDLPHHRHSDAFLGELLDLGEEAAAGEGEVGPQGELRREAVGEEDDVLQLLRRAAQGLGGLPEAGEDRKSTRLNSSHVKISYAVFC